MVHRSHYRYVLGLPSFLIWSSNNDFVFYLHLQFSIQLLLKNWWNRLNKFVCYSFFEQMAVVQLPHVSTIRAMFIFAFFSFPIAYSLHISSDADTDVCSATPTSLLMS